MIEEPFARIEVAWVSHFQDFHFFWQKPNHLIHVIEINRDFPVFDYLNLFFE